MVLYTPVDVVMQRAFVGYGRRGADCAHAPVRDAVRATYAVQGLRGFYSGYWASLATFAPGCAVWWSVYGMARRALTSTESITLPQWGAESVAGLCAGIASAIVTHPLDTVKTRLQTGVDGAGASWLSVARSLTRSAGARGLFRGLGARVLELGPVSAVGAASYELIKRVSSRAHTEQQQHAE